MPDTQNQTLSENTTQGVSLEELLSGPIQDIVKAQNALATAQMNFILENCFKKNGDTYEPVMIELAVNSNKPGMPLTDDRDKSLMNLPMLSIMPLNSLNIDNVTLNFDLDVAMVNMPSLQCSTPQVMVKTIETPQGNVEANITAQQDNTLNRLKLTVELGQLPLSNDADAIIAAFAQSVSPIK